MERKEAIEVIKKNWPDSSFTIVREALETLIPEFAELEDERIRKEIIEHIRWSFNFGNCAEEKMQRWITWLEKQGVQEQLYIRFGKIPTDEKSKIYQGEIEVGTENGVSVYPAFKTDEGDIVLGLNLPITKTTLHTQQHLIEYDDRPCYLVKGNYVGKDTDGQPLINNVSIIEKINSYRVKEEKQGEQKPADNVEPKFKVGQTIKKEGFNLGFTIVKIEDGFYYNDIGDYFPFTDQDNWELVEQKPAEIVKCSPQEESCICQLESLVKEQWRQAERVHNSVNVKKMSELMFFLKTLNPNKKPQRIISAEVKEAMYDKPTWSEEDEENFNWFEKFFRAESVIAEGKDIPQDRYLWFKSLKERYTWKPSNEQMEGIECTIKTLRYQLNAGDNRLDSLYNDLKKLRGE